MLMCFPSPKMLEINFKHGLTPNGFGPPEVKAKANAEVAEVKKAAGMEKQAGFFSTFLPYIVTAPFFVGMFWATTDASWLAKSAMPFPLLYPVTHYNSRACSC